MSKTQIEILDSDLNEVAIIKTLYPLDAQGTVLRYSKELSDYGQANFRISSYDPIFTNTGDILTPLAYHVRIRRDAVVVWQGAIIENPKRTKDFVEVIAAEYLWYLDKILVNRTSDNPATGAADKVYRIFNSGTMAAAVTAIMTETVARYASTNHLLTLLTVGEIENPDYPPNMTDGNNPPNALSGPWEFGDGVSAPEMTFDFHSILYILKSFGAYSYADFNIDENLNFNFYSFLGNDRHYDVNFIYGERGNAVDFNITRLGQQMVNDLWGIASDNNGQILHEDQSNLDSIQTYGLLEAVAAYSDIKDQATLNARVIAELPLIDTPDSSANTLVLSEKAYPLGVYDIGDIVTTKVDHIAVQYEEISRVVGITVSLNSTGRELTTVQTNRPRPGEYGTI